MPSKIDEELRQYKLFKIQETNVRLRQFQQAYSKIKENIAIKFSKNVTFNLLKIAFLLLCICSLVITVFCFLPGEFILLIEEYEGPLSSSEKKGIVIIFRYLRFLFLAIAAIFYLLSYLLKLNNRKRNTIYSLSQLLEEMITYLEKSSDEEKRKYEQYVDFLAKKEGSSSTKNNNP